MEEKIKFDGEKQQSSLQATTGSVSDYLRILAEEGKRVEATSPLIDVNQRPDYFDLARFKRAQKTCQKYYTNLSLSSTTGLMLLLQIDSILVPLLRSGKSRTVANLWDRYTATAKFVRKYYESDFCEPDTEGWKFINLVRSMHKHIHKHMREDSELGPSQNAAGDLWVNQHDMAVTQFAFVGLFLLYPKKCVAYRVTRDELTDVAYYWRLISYYLGIEDRFNIFSLCDDLDNQIELMGAILRHVDDLRAQTQRGDTGRRMAEGFMLAFEDFLTESNFNILNHWWSSHLSLSGDHKLKPYSLDDRWRLIYFKFYFNILFRSETIMSWLNRMYKKKFDKFCASGDKVKAKLNRKYRDISYEL